MKQSATSKWEPPSPSKKWMAGIVRVRDWRSILPIGCPGMGPTPIAARWANACPPKPNGKKPHAGPMKEFSPGADEFPAQRFCHLSPEIFQIWIRCHETGRLPCPKGNLPTACITWRAMCGNGWPTGMKTVITSIRPKKIRKARRRESAKSCAAATGTTKPTTCAPPIASTSTPIFSKSGRVSVAPNKKTRTAAGPGFNWRRSTINASGSPFP